MEHSCIYLKYKREREKAKLLKRVEKKKAPKKTEAEEVTVKPTKVPMKTIAEEVTVKPTKVPMKTKAEEVTVKPAKVPKKTKAEEVTVKPIKVPMKTIAEEGTVKPTKVPKKTIAEEVTVKPTKVPKKTKAEEVTVKPAKVQQSVAVSLPIIHFINQQTKRIKNNATKMEKKDDIAQLPIPELVINSTGKSKNKNITKKLRQIRRHSCNVSTNEQNNNTNESNNNFSNTKVLQDLLFSIGKNLADILKNGVSFLKSNTNKNKDEQSQHSKSPVLKHHKVTVPVKKGIHCTDNAVVELKKESFYTKESKDGQSGPNYVITRHGLKILDLLVEHGKTHKLEATDQVERNLKNYKQISQLLAAESKNIAFYPIIDLIEDKTATKRKIINMNPVIDNKQLNEKKVATQSDIIIVDHQIDPSVQENQAKCDIIDLESIDDTDQLYQERLNIALCHSEANKSIIRAVQNHMVNLTANEIVDASTFTSAIYNNQKAKDVSTQAGNGQSDEVNLHTLAETANSQNKLMLPTVVTVLKKDCQLRQNQLAQKQWEKAQELQSHEQRMQSSQLLPPSDRPSQSQKSQPPQSLPTQPKPPILQPPQLVRIQPSQLLRIQPSQQSYAQMLPPPPQPQQLHPTQQWLQPNYPQPTQLQQSRPQLRAIPPNPPQTQLPLQPPAQPLQQQSSHLPLIQQVLSYYMPPAQQEPTPVQPTQQHSAQLQQMHPNPPQRQLQLQQPPKPHPPQAEPPKPHPPRAEPPKPHPPRAEPPKPHPPRAEPPQQQLFHQGPYPQPIQMPFSHLPTFYEPQQWQQYNYVQQQQYGQQNAQYTPRQYNYHNVYRTQAIQKPVKEKREIYLHPGDPRRPPQAWSTARARPDCENNSQHAHNAQYASCYPHQMQGNNPNHYW